MRMAYQCAAAVRHIPKNATIRERVVRTNVASPPPSSTAIPSFTLAANASQVNCVAIPMECFYRAIINAEASKRAVTRPLALGPQASALRCNSRVILLPVAPLQGHARTMRTAPAILPVARPNLSKPTSLPAVGTPIAPTEQHAMGYLLRAPTLYSKVI